MKKLAFLFVAMAACSGVPVSGPGNLTVSDGALTWVDQSANESEFIVERKVTGGRFAPVASLPANTTTWKDPTATTPGTYVYRVLASQAGNHWGGAYSNEVSFTR